jgi:hypothetical protein
MIGFLPATVTNILKLCRASAELHGAGDDWISIVEEAEELRISACQYLNVKETWFHRLLECYTNTQLLMLNTLQLNSEDAPPP